MEKLIFLTYARKSSRHNWNLYSRTGNSTHAMSQAVNLLNDIEKDTRFINDNWNIQIVTVRDSQFNGQYPETLKSNIRWYELLMIPYADMQQNPDQTIYNGGN